MSEGVWTKIWFFFFEGKIVDKKAELVNGPKSHHIQVTQSPNQLLQEPATQTTVNSTNNNSSVSNNNRKSTETVTSSPEDHVEEEPAKALSESTDDNREVKAGAAKTFAELDEKIEVSLKEDHSELKDELQQPQIKSSSDAAKADTNNGAEIVPQSKEPAIDSVKSEDESLSVKKVCWLLIDLKVLYSHFLINFQSLVDYEAGDSDEDVDEEDTEEPAHKKARLA